MKKTPTIKFVWRKFILSALLTAPLATLPSPLWAVLPGTTSANLTSSAGASTVITGTATYMNINTPDRTVLTWGAFGIASTDTINFDLPTTTSGVLNIVNGGASTTIAGAMTSIGNVYILNKNGITIDTATAAISVANLGLSTADEAPFNFQTTGVLSYPATATVPVHIIGNGTGTITATSNGTVTIVGKGVDLTGTIVAGALNINSQGGNVVLGNSVSNNAFTLGSSGSKTGNLTVNSATGNIDLANGTGAVTIWGGTANLTTGNGNVLQSSTGTLAIGKSNANSSLTINAGTGTVNLPKVDANAATGTALAATITANATTLGVDIGDITLNASTINGNLIVGSLAGVIGSGGNVTITGGGTVSLAAPAANNITFAGAGNITFANLSTTDAVAAAFNNTVTLSTTGGFISLPTAQNITPAGTTYKNLSVKASGNITNSAAVNSTSGTVTFDAGDTLTITSSALPTVVVKNSPNGATITSTAATTSLGKGTAATGNVTVTAPAIAFGTGAGDTLTFTNLALTATAAGPATTISDVSDKVTVTGALTLTPAAGNSVVLDGNLGTGVGFAGNYGQVNIVNGANATVFGKAGLNLGTIAITGNLMAIATTGNITDSGQLKVGGWVTAGAGTAAAPGNINLDYTAAAGSGNQITGTIYLQDDINLLLGTSVAGTGATTIGNYMANNVTVMNENAITVSPIFNTYAAGLTGNLTLTGAGVTLGKTLIGGTANLTSTGAITASNAGNVIPSFNINATKTTAGAVVVNVNSSGNTTVNATLSGPTGNGSSAVITSGGNLTIGTVTSSFDGAGGVAFTGTGAITDSTIAGIQIYGPVSFTSTGNISVTKGGDNFGAVTMDIGTNDGNTMSLVESGTMKIASISNAGKKTTINLTSQNGSIIEATNATIKGGSDTTKTMSLSAVNGSIVLDQPLNHTFAGPISFTVNGTAGSGNVTYLSNSSVVLGNTTVSGGTLNIDVSNTTGNSLSQATGASAYAYGNLILKAASAGAGTGNITLTNSGNRFGAYEITNGSGNVSITEDTTINLQAINTAGNLTITSNNGYILDSVNTSLAAGYTNSVVASGAGKIAKFTANAAGGNITLALPNSQFIASVALNTTGAASVISNAAASALDLGTSTVGGALSVTNNSSGQMVTQSGPLAVTGTVSINTTGGASGINLSNPNNQFGGLRFYAAGTTGANIAEATTMNLLGGSLSNGPVFLSTAGNFITTGPGGSSISGNLNISANGTITPGAGSLLVTGTFTVYSIGATDLSALSKSGNLFNKAPVNTGPGAYTGPSL